MKQDNDKPESDIPSGYNQKLAQNRLSEKTVNRIIRSLQKEYFLVGKTRIRSWHAWLLIGLAAGIATGVILVANRSGKLELSRASSGTAGVPQCGSSWNLDILDDPKKMITNDEWEPSIAVSDRGDIAAVQINGGFWVKPAGGAWQPEIGIKSCDFDSACRQGTKICGGDPIIGWDQSASRFVVTAKCADNSAFRDFQKELGVGTVENIGGQWQWIGWKKAVNIGYDFANLGVGPGGTYWISGIIDTIKILSGQESKAFYSSDPTFSKPKSWLPGPKVPGFMVGMAPLTDKDFAGVGLDGIEINNLFSQSPLQSSLHFFRLKVVENNIELMALKKNIAQAVFPSKASLLSGLADCTSGKCSGKSIANTYMGFYRHPLVAYEKNGQWTYRSLLPSSEIRGDRMVWATTLQEVTSLDGGVSWNTQKLAGGLNGDPNNPSSWKDAHLGGMTRDPSTGLIHLFYHYRDGADKIQESLYYRTLDTNISNASWSKECALPRVKDLAPDKGPGTGRDYADISVNAGRVAIVFQTASARCQFGQTKCPKSVLGVLKNF